MKALLILATFVYWFVGLSILIGGAAEGGLGWLPLGLFFLAMFWFMVQIGDGKDENANRMGMLFAVVLAALCGLRYVL